MSVSLPSGRPRPVAVALAIVLAVGLAVAYLTSIRPVEAAAPAVYSGYKNGGFVTGEKPFGSLNVPAGNYQVIAKLSIRPGCFESMGCPASYNYTCELSAGNSWDTSSVKVIGPNNPATLPVAEVTMTVASYVPAGTPITVRCFDIRSTSHTMTFSYLKINATRVDSLSVTKLP